MMAKPSRAMHFNHLREAMLSAAGFLDNTVKHVKIGDIRIAEIASRCEDLAATLREAESKTSEAYFSIISETSD